MAPVKMNLPQTEIGMALGSPQHPPMAWQQATMDRYTESPEPTDDDLSTTAPVKPKTSKWKLLGGLFGGKKAEAAPTAFYQLQPEPSQQPPINHGFDFGEAAVSSEKPKSRHRGRSNSSALKSRKHKPEISRSKTVPRRFDFGEPTRQDQNGTPEITVDEGSVVYDGPRSIQKGAGLLDVDIPSVQMERYSIMFGSVLQKPQSQLPSLLDRRQATLDKLGAVSDALASEENEEEAKPKPLLPRRATSPGFQTQSPAFSLFPSAPHTREASPSSQSQPSTTLRRRSNTSPAALSPARPSFAPRISNEDHAKLVWADSPTVPTHQHPDNHRDPRALKKKESKVAPGSAPEAKTWSQDQTHLSLDFFSDNHGEREDDKRPIAIPMKPKLTDSSWRMANPNHAASYSVSISSTHSASMTASSITTPLSTSTAPYSVVQPPHLNSPPQTRTRAATIAHKPSISRSRSLSSSAPAPLPVTSSPKSKEDEARLESAAGISIARQISVSRQQRQLLVPIKRSKSLKSPSSTGSAGKKFVSPSIANPNGSLKKDRVVGAQNFPSPASGIGLLRMGKVSSPLGAIATATKEELEREKERGREIQIPQTIQTNSREKSPPRKRVVKVAKSSTPTLVVVGHETDEAEKARAGAIASMSSNFFQLQAPIGFSERRRQKKAARSRSLSFSASPSSSSSSSHSNPILEEIRVRLAVARDSSPARHARGPSHRKSERVVVESIGVAFN